MLVGCQIVSESTTALNTARDGVVCIWIKEQNINSQIERFIEEGGTVYVCRFGLSLHGLREEDLIAGCIPCHPLDVQDALIYFARKGAIINSTYMV